MVHRAKNMDLCAKIPSKWWWCAATAVELVLLIACSFVERFFWCSSNRIGVRVTNMNDLFTKSGKVLLCLCIVFFHGPGLVNCDTCSFPSRWTGSWFQKGSPDPIRIYNGTVSTKGTCRDNDGDKFLIENTLEKCFRCVVLHEKHINVLQYKETHCSTQPHHQYLENLCSEINGDALLYSMFRFNTPAVPCPFKGSFVFSYSRGHGECAYPASTVDSCTDDSHLLLRFQACADVMGSESRVEELVCLATWKEGSTRYLVGKLEHRVAKADEDKFRCFVYEQTEDNLGYMVAQSGDATCDGLFTAYEGSRTMKLTKANHPHAKCHYPDWFTTYHHWRGLDGKLAYDIGHKNGSFRVSNATTGDVVKRVVCTQDHHHSFFPSPVSTPATGSITGGIFAQFVVHVTSGCNSGYTCLRIHKRAPHVVELQSTSRLSTIASEACNGINFDTNPSEIVTLTTQTSGSLECPMAGIYALEGNARHMSRLISLDAANADPWPCTGYTTLTSGCSAVDKMELVQECANERKTNSFQCRGSWEENGTNYVIATAVGTRKHLCLAYSESERTIHFSGSTEACLRNVQLGREGSIAINGTSKGYCPTTDGGHTTEPYKLHITLISVFIMLFIFHNYR
ncbi:uncharacterized protein LOC129228234 [Uloborus diversus]|uniref:uncharacterized protein LOC129228234 n=1 Tax=Uloborus diversus TaxID=327109 RepID=UPI002408FBCA|nr:uncharacterized protein LOC129228234 [Uloborus diversus]